MGNAAPAMRGDAPPIYVNTDHAARVLGVSPATLRRRLAGGEIPGATRIGARGSAWRIPLASLLCTCGKPASHVHADPDSPDWPCRVPAPSVTTAPRRAVIGVRGVSADPFRDDPNVTSPQHSPAAIVATAHRVSQRLSAVTTRPSLALADVMSTLAAAAVRHTSDADGRCMACKWPTFPCPDAELLRLAIDRAASIVLDGAS